VTMKSQFVNLLIFSALTATVFATIMRDDTRARVRLGLKIFAAFVAAALAVGWLMYPFPS
jgi:heme/copper-type cytochrome/quinol oxidase subunit 4